MIWDRGDGRTFGRTLSTANSPKEATWSILNDLAGNPPSNRPDPANAVDHLVAVMIPHCREDQDRLPT
jgi:hypothetical protein